MRALVGMALAAFVFASGAATAANQPCSGKKGGISHCVGALFICVDGSPSQSKRNCSAEGYGGAAAADAKSGRRTRRK